MSLSYKGDRTVTLEHSSITNVSLTSICTHWVTLRLTCRFSTWQINFEEGRSQATEQATEPRRVDQNRKAQQRFRQRQKARKASETPELRYLSGRVQELEQTVSTGLDHNCPPASQTLAQVQQLLASERCTSCYRYCLLYKRIIW